MEGHTGAVKTHRHGTERKTGKRDVFISVVEK